MLPVLLPPRPSFAILPEYHPSHLSHQLNSHKDIESTNTVAAVADAAAAVNSSSCEETDIDVDEVVFQQHQQQYKNLLQKKLIQFTPFPVGSINLLTATSCSGKTQFLAQVIQQRHCFFEAADLISRVVYVNGNQRDFTLQHPWSSDINNQSINNNNSRSSGDKDNDNDDVDDNNQAQANIEVLSLTLDEFSDLASILQPRDILILDDILKINEDILYIVKYGAHHYSLASVFIVTQSCLSSPLYSLVSAVHNIILLFGNTATNRLAQHLIHSYFLCTQTKQFLKTIFSIADQHHDTVILKLNSVASYPLHSKVLAVVCVQRLFKTKNPFCLLYPELSHSETLLKKTMLESIEANLDLEGTQQHYKDAFVLLPACRVKALEEHTANSNESQNKICKESEKEAQWEHMIRYLQDEIENAFPLKRWNHAKNLAREILRCKQLCISADYRTVFIEGKPKKAYSIIDFLNIATRHAGPAEHPAKIEEYQPLVQVLLKHKVPRTFFLNKLFLTTSDYSLLSRQRRRPRHNNRYRPSRIDYYHNQHHHHHQRDY